MKMLQYTVKRFVIMLFTLFIIATATFFLLAATPGDALSARVEKLPDSVAARMYAKYGLDKPVMERYVITMKGLVHGDFGESIIYEGQTVQSIIKEKAPISARLGIQQMLLGVSLGLALGVLAAVKKGSFWDYLVVALSILLISVPNLVFALLLQQVFAGKLGWFPVIGWPSDHLWTSGWNYTVLPTLAGCFGYIASYARLLKASMLDVMNQDYILTAESKGLTHREVILHHVLRNSFIPIVTNLPMSVAMCITGSFFIESVFSIPGLGLYYVNAVAAQDVTIVMGETVILAALYIIVVFVTDILYTVVDPRIRIRGRQAVRRRGIMSETAKFLTPEQAARVDHSRFDAEKIDRPTITYWQGAWRRLKKNPLAVVAMVMLAVVLFFVLLGPTISGQEYIKINASIKNTAPNSANWFGTDTMGRDIFCRVWIGARLSLIVALVCSTIQIVVGCAYGGAMAYFGGTVDSVMMRVIEVITSFPSLLITLLIMMVVGQNVGGLLFAMCITSWCGTARQMRGQLMQLRESEYVQAAQMIGASPVRIIIKHLLPNTVSILILNLCSSIPSYIFTEASLSFLGMGLSSDVISLGVLISQGKAKMDFYPWQLFFPAAVLCIAVLAFNLLGDGLRDALDPRTIE